MLSCYTCEVVICVKLLFVLGVHSSSISRIIFFVRYRLLEPRLDALESLLFTVFGWALP